MPKDHAILLATAVRPAMIRLLPWYAGPRARQVQAATDRATARLAARVGHHDTAYGHADRHVAGRTTAPVLRP